MTIQEVPRSLGPSPPGTVTITGSQSYAWVLREEFIVALKRLPYFEFFNVRRNQQQGPIQPQQDFPLLGVYILNEVMTPDDAEPALSWGNAGEIKFVNRCRIGFSVMIVNNNPDAAEKELDEAFWAIQNGLWRDQYLTGFMHTWNPHTQHETPDNTRFEAIERGMRQNKFGSAGSTNETPYAELQYEITVRYRDEFAPVITDDLLRIHEEVFPGQYGRDENGEVVHIIVEYDFTSDPPTPPDQPPPSWSAGGDEPPP